ncbi:GlcNAc-PI de-N-acetylase [Kocuria soli]|uniref:GlcNAc-PI de-N-acetylase n=1 Tax=Kocuria soli TaxID=2485125 RepID=A0A3N4A9K8_9MICC|nr:PIG-L family deacetylase [Kocuria soli]ROZ62303.1 GlcNAc-PI de-N-acetylase [Kocuria soli]
MSVLVFLHAHPDDESSGTSGTMAKAVAEGHRVVEIIATNGDHGTPPPAPKNGEPVLGVVEHRRLEAAAAAREIGIHRVEWLGYTDSGMTGWEQNSANRSFMGADVDEAAAKVAAILDQESADVLVGYDWHGNYGHPDHVKVHAVAHRAAELAATRPRLLETSMNRDEMRRRFEAAVAAGADPETLFDPEHPGDDGNGLGLPESELHWAVELDGELLAVKRRALGCHSSQEDVQNLLSLPQDQFEAAFGTEHYREAGRPDGMLREWPF